MEETEKKEQDSNESSSTEKEMPEKKKEKKISLKESEHQALIDTAAEYKDKYVRLYAEFDNARKRMEREKQDFVKFSNESLILEFLHVIDHLELSVKAAQTNPKDTENLVKGVEMVLANAREVLKRNKVEPIEVVGSSFNPNQHEVLMQEPSDEKEGTILEEIQRGYLFHDRVLRTAKVKVASKKEN